jgi:DNA polymerase-3 subunit epsilon
MPIETLLILDTETTGIDPARDRIVEVGAVLWSVAHSCTLATWSELVVGEGNPAEAVNRIPAAALPRGVALKAALSTLKALAARADLAVAHNAAFDRAFLGDDLGLPWVCSMEDVAWPRTSGGRSLAVIALAHDVGIVTAHRALADCLILARLFERVGELGCDVQQLIQQGMRPKVLFQAMVSYADRDQAKSAGFTWDADGKRWVRRLAPEDAQQLPFRVVQVKP